MRSMGKLSQIFEKCRPVNVYGGGVNPISFENLVNFRPVSESGLRYMPFVSRFITLPLCASNSAFIPHVRIYKFSPNTLPIQGHHPALCYSLPFSTALPVTGLFIVSVMSLLFQIIFPVAKNFFPQGSLFFSVKQSINQIFYQHHSNDLWPLLEHGKTSAKWVQS